MSVQEALIENDINMGIDEISTFKKEAFSEMVKIKVRNTAFVRLMLHKNTLTKMSNLEYSNLSMKPYLKMGIKFGQLLYSKEFVLST